MIFLTPRLMARQRGATLVSLMVGMMISLIVVTAMMLVFRSVSQSTVQARRDAHGDDQLTSALLSAGIVLQDAGFGIQSAALGTHLMVVNGALLAANGTLSGNVVASGSPRTGNALLWQQNIGGALQCAGLYSPATGGLQRLQPVACTQLTSSWNTAAWGTSVLADTATAAITLAIDELAAGAACGPFGIPEAAGHVRASLRANNSNGAAFTSSQCLVNFPEP